MTTGVPSGWVAHPSAEQLAVTQRFDVRAVSPLGRARLGIARNVRDGVQPINGLRHPVEGDTSGWYIWAGGEFPDDPDFFVPLHHDHLSEWCPVVLPYLALPPGWRFLLAPGHEDVWFDETLLVT